METLREIAQWLGDCPLLPPLQADRLEADAPCGALFSQGIQCLWRKADVQGGWRGRFRLVCELRIRTLSDDNAQVWEQSERWLAVQDWVLAHPARLLGDNPVCLLEKGRLLQENGDGTAVYTAVLTVEYTRNG